MITTEFGAMECVNVMQSAYDETVTMAHIRQPVVVSSVGKHEPLRTTPSKPKVIETKYRYVWAKADDGASVDDVNKVLAKAKGMRINRIRGCELFTVLTPGQISFYEGATGDERIKVETNWLNDRLSTSTEGVPWLFGDLELEQYYQDLLVDEVKLHGDVDLRQRDHDRILEDKAATAALAAADESAPALTQLAHIGAERL